jgi:RNA polymerase sigma-70 factor (ECF subfamily)
MSEEIDFRKVYKEFQPKILHYIKRLTGNHEAEDVTQEVFEKVSRSLESFRGDSMLSTWIYRIATNTALDKLRSPSFNRSAEHTPLEDITQPANGQIWNDQKEGFTDQNIIRKEMSECVREFIDKLPPDYKTVVILSELAGFKNREIAEILQVSLDTVKIRLHRARTSLKKELGDGCSFYHNEEGTFACDRKPITIQSTVNSKESD